MDVIVGMLLSAGYAVIGFWSSAVATDLLPVFVLTFTAVMTCGWVLRRWMR